MSKIYILLFPAIRRGKLFDKHKDVPIAFYLLGGKYFQF